MSNKTEVEHNFNEANLKRHQLTEIPKSFQQSIYYMDYKIRKELKTFTLLSICGGDRNNFVVDTTFQRAFSTLTLSEKVNYYANVINLGLNACRINDSGKQISPIKNQHPETEQQKVKFDIKMFKGYRSWEQTPIEIVGFKVISKARSSINIDLRNYLLRNSKKKDKRCFVLQAIKNEDPESIRFSFMSEAEEHKYLPKIKQKINAALQNSIWKQISDINKKKRINQMRVNRQFKLKNQNDGKPKREVVQQQQLKDKNIMDNDQTQFLHVQSNLVTNQREKGLENRSICEEMVKDIDQQELEDQLSEIIAKKNQEIQQLEEALQNQKKSKLSKPIELYQYRKNIFRIFLPNYQLSLLPTLYHYKCIYQSPLNEFYLYQHTQHNLVFKMQCVMELPIDVACRAIYNMHLYKNWHPEVIQAQVKFKISSENSCLTYQNLKSYSQWYRERDFLVLLHLFKDNENYYIVGKSIENTNYIPLMSITRGNLDYFIWKIEPEPGSNGQKCKIVMESKIDHGGLLNKSHQKQLSERYLKGFENMQDYFKTPEHQSKLTNQLYLNWTNFVPQEENEAPIPRMNSFQTCDFESGSEISDQDDEIFYSIENLDIQEDIDFGNSTFQNTQHPLQKENANQSVKSQKKNNFGKKKMDAGKKTEQPPLIIFPDEEQSQNEGSQHEIDEIELKKSCKSQVTNLQKQGDVQNIEVDEEGLIILPKKYLKKNFIMQPDPNKQEVIRIQKLYDNLIEKDIWMLQKQGGLKMINKEKIKAQDNVFSFVLKTLKKNLFSGKGALNISLPVDIFGEKSNLQQLAGCLSYGPEFLEPAVKYNEIDRFKWVLAYGLSNSVMYFDIEKPFNPILGQTYQGYIRGCPVYAQQISHHPPISSIYFIGRGYKVYGCIQSKVNIHMNSADGVNQGFFHVVFDDGQQILFQTPAGELSGLAVGDRRINLIERGYYVDQKNNLYCEMKFVDDGGFFSKKKRNFIDELSGTIVRVKPGFITKFMKAPDDKKPSPDKSDVLETFGQISGRWPIEFRIDGELFYDVTNSIPEKLFDEIYPLNSNSNYREDLFYKKQKDIVKSQSEKERLEVKQRNDRKLREKLGKKKH